MKKFTSILMALLAIAGIFASSACSNKKKNMSTEDNKMIVCYFSATGTTAAQAKRIADMTGASLYEIIPETAYTAVDLDWTDSLSRSSVEMHNRAFRPALKDSVVNLADYDVVLIGYPNWWNTCPTIINTFIESAHLDGKTVVPFMTSGGSNITNSEKELAVSYPGINWKKGLLMNGVSDDQIKDWISNINELATMSDRPHKSTLFPTSTSQRHIFLDALRGFALLGVCLANYPEFSLYTFQPDSVIEAMQTAGLDRTVKFLQYLFIDGKFYTLFSLLFGIGFSIIISHAAERGANGFRIFYRRMIILALIGCTHLMMIWSGDILLLYAVLGMILPLFRNMSDKKTLITAGILLLLPILVDGIAELTGVFFAKYPYDQWWHYAGIYGITEENFGTWLRDADSYREIHQFLIQGAWERMYEFIDGNRYFKVMGLFLIGFVVGRHKIYADLKAHKTLLNKVALWGCVIGLPLSVVYAASGVNSHPMGNTIHTMLYTISVYPLGFAYAALLGLFCIRHKDLSVWRWFAAPGRMALTNYIGQSIIGMFLFYGIGFGFGATVGLAETELVALIVFLCQIFFSMIWLSLFRFGPLEWIWRMLTYGKWLKIT